MKPSIVSRFSAASAASLLILNAGCGRIRRLRSLQPTPPLPTTWSDSMPKGQKVAFMKKNIVPTRGPLFQAYDSTRYANFGCSTCHGPDRKDPTEYLPHLTS